MTAASPSPSYRHRQPAGRWLLALWVLALTVAVAAAVAEAGFGLLPVVVLAFAFLFRCLTVTVEDGAVRVRFGSGWPARTISLGDVVDQRRVRNRWWYGFGIRLTPHGWLWNLDGLDAVELELVGGRCFRIGTDDPVGLLEAIDRARPAAPSTLRRTSP